MAINCVTYNCRGWNSGSVTISDFIDLFDICFIQEHWLLTDQLHILSSYHPEFAAVSVSGIDDLAVLMVGVLSCIGLHSLLLLLLFTLYLIVSVH